jgi:exopolysaccharide biosynthesis polyprenyl glycosylphosphotransferase
MITPRTRNPHCRWLSTEGVPLPTELPTTDAPDRNTPAADVRGAAVLPLRSSHPPFTTWAARTKRAVQRVVQTCDLLIPLGVLLLILVVENRDQMPRGPDDFLELRLTLRNLLVIAGFVWAWRMICVTAGLYDWKRLASRSGEAARIISAAGGGTLVALIFPALSAYGAFRLTGVGYFWVLTTVMMLLQRKAVRVALLRRAPQEVLIVGTGSRSAAVYEALCRGQRGAVHVAGFVDSSAGASEEIRRRHLGGLDDLEGILMHHPIDQVLITLPVRSHYSEIQRTVEVCERVGVTSEYLADVFSFTRATPRFEEADPFSAMAVPVASEDPLRLLVKRGMDVIGAAAGLIVLAPVMVCVAVAIKLESPGPVLYVQERFGLRKRRFRMYKFRTMVADAESRQASLEALNEATGPVFKLSADPRVTRLGRLLRRTSIDELPQLLNVLRGEMSLVGPRPLPGRDVARFAEGSLMRRFSVRPGLTCLWQVGGRSNLSFQEWITLDLKYIDEWSLWLDLRLLLQTIPAVLRGTGAK